MNTKNGIPKITIGDKAAYLSKRLAKITEYVVVALMIVLIGMVWLGIFVRYFGEFNISFTEEASRYLMIWVALLAISIGISKREHIGIVFIIDRFPSLIRRILLALIDLITFTFFAILLFYSANLIDTGWTRFTMIYEIPKAYPFFIIPLSATIACVQVILVAIRDQYKFDPDTASGKSGGVIA